MIDPNGLIGFRIVIDPLCYGTCEMCGREMVPLFEQRVMISQDGEWSSNVVDPRESCGLCFGKFLDAVPRPDRQRGKGEA